MPPQGRKNKAREAQSRETRNFHNHSKWTSETSATKTNELPWPLQWLQLHIAIPVQHSHSFTKKLMRKFGLQSSSFMSVLRTFVLALKQQKGEDKILTLNDSKGM